MNWTKIIENSDVRKIKELHHAALEQSKKVLDLKQKQLLQKEKIDRILRNEYLELNSCKNY